MLNRQRVLLEMLRLAARPVTKLELVKWAFVLRRETTSSGGSAFYEFVPYHYGPYSFAMTRELQGLAELGYVQETEKSWEIAHDVPIRKKDLSGTVCRDVERVVNRLGKKPVNDVIDYVYRTYPAFTVNSKRQQLAERTRADVAIYTAGYEGLQVDGFLNILVQSGVYRLIDVRSNPIARRYGFHKSTLSRLCGFIGVEYVHIPELGISSNQRRSLETEDDYQTLFDLYEQTTLKDEGSSINRVADLIQEKPSVLVCMEADHHFCHRARLANEVAARTGLPIVHLEAEP